MKKLLKFPSCYHPERIILTFWSIRFVLKYSFNILLIGEKRRYKVNIRNNYENIKKNYPHYLKLFSSPVLYPHYAYTHTCTHTLQSQEQQVSNWQCSFFLKLVLIIIIFPHCYLVFLLIISVSVTYYPFQCTSHNPRLDIKLIHGFIFWPVQILLLFFLLTIFY